MLAETVKAIVEKAKAEGTKPDPEELKAAVMALVDGEDGAVTVDVDIAIEAGIFNVLLLLAKY